MKVALLGDATSVHVRRWAENIEARGVEVVVFSPDQPTWAAEWVEMPLRWPTIPFTGLGTWRAGRWLAARCRSHGVDIVHSHYVSGLAHIANASRFHPVVVTPWGSDILRLGEVPVRSALRTKVALRNADLVMCGSRYLRDASVNLGVSPGLCRLVGWGVDTSKYAPNKRVRARMRADLGVEDHEVVLLSTRVLGPLYRIGAIIEAFAAASDSRDDLVLVVLGDGPERAALEALTGALGVAGRVHFIGRVERMPDILVAADAVVSVPRSDGGPLSLLEAMSVGLPVVGSDLPSYREWVQPGVTGELWGSGDVADLTRAILAVASYPAGSGKIARNLMRAKAERSAQFDRAVELYAALAAGDPLPPDPEE